MGGGVAPITLPPRPHLPEGELGTQLPKRQRGQGHTWAPRGWPHLFRVQIPWRGKRECGLLARAEVQEDCCQERGLLPAPARYG